MNIRNIGQYIERFLKIRTKDGSLQNLVMNAPQRRLYEAIRKQWDEGKPIRIIILKARQMGFSTLTEAILFALTATNFHVETMIVAHKEDSTANLFRMSQRFYEELPDMIKPKRKAANARELVFDSSGGNGKGLGSRIRCATAGGKGVGRSSTISCLHLSEFAFWPGNKLESYTGLVQAVPDRPGTVIIIESTANGFDEFKEMWDAAVDAEKNGTDGYTPIFFAWHEMEEYRRPPLPGFQRTAEEEEMAQTFGLDDEQLAWRRWCIATNCGGDIDLFHQEYPSTPDEAFISTGMCAFDTKILVLRRDQVQHTPWERGMFRIVYDVAEPLDDYETGVDAQEIGYGPISSFEWVQDDRGPVWILKHPEASVPYVLGADTAGTGTDFFAAHVLDNRSGEQVAKIHHQFGERAFAEQMYCLGMYFNKALIGVEVNYSTFPEMCLEELGYPNLYVRQRVDTFTKKIIPAYGFETTRKTRQLIIDGLKDVVKHTPELIHDYDTLGEMLTFVYDEAWKPQAQEGKHDDLVMSLAIAHFIRSQQTTGSVAPVSKGGSQWTDDMLEDFNRASPRMREEMIRMWGEPGR